ncbi:MAG TPA: L-seryl-tRNA(Sec) selenium transferase [Syntrophorhabdaceae bacterium]|jgi:L-seryl-tRNA(Ser) seleniumtransferase
MNELLRRIPKVDDLFKVPGWVEIVRIYPEGLAKDVLRDCLDRLRAGIKNGNLTAVPPVEAVLDEVRAEVARRSAPSLKRVINATGVIIHTNLGRSLLPASAVKAITNAAGRYVNLEYDLAEGARGDRYEHCTFILRKLTGCENALVVNNNAAAVILVLNTLAEGREVVISRGELVEIGGSFRIPEVMKKSGAVLREVGTTNRTYKEDFERAIGGETALLMKAHTSNFRIKGFVREIGVDELAELGRTHDVPTYFDAGSGLLMPLKELGISGEPLIREDLAKGMDVISFSGDKLPGAPQAGIIIGKDEYIRAIRKNPLARALRADKLTLAGLEATLLLYLDGEKAKAEVPTLQMLHMDEETLRRRASRIVRILKGRLTGSSVEPAGMFSEVGGGTLPDVYIPSFGIVLKPEGISASRLEERLRCLEIPIIARIEKEAVLLDLRCVLKDEEPVLISGIVSALANG